MFDDPTHALLFAFGVLGVALVLGLVFMWKTFTSQPAMKGMSRLLDVPGNETDVSISDIELDVS